MTSSIKHREIPNSENKFQTLNHCISVIIIQTTLAFKNYETFFISLAFVTVKRNVIVSANV